MKAYEEIIDFIAKGTTPETVIGFRASDAAREHVTESVEQSKAGTISDEDKPELEDCLLLEHIMILAKARARQRLLHNR
jgi:hypothetical protein